MGMAINDNLYLGRLNTITQPNCMHTSNANAMARIVPPCPYPTLNPDHGLHVCFKNYGYALRSPLLEYDSSPLFGLLVGGNDSGYHRKAKQ